jgi:glycosyltransferase involved in cell wall biosynthesis
MRILAVHNYYQQRGGEDQCFDDEVRVLRGNDHQVETLTIHNNRINNTSKLKVALGTIWSRSASAQIQQIIQSFRPDIVHAMNTFPLLSPSVLRTAKRLGVPVVQEVQNYRFTCAGAFLLRDGKVCETCLHSLLPIAAVRHRCYRGSLAGSLTLASSIAIHKQLGSWKRHADLFLCPSEITKQKLVEFGIPADRIFVKPNVLDFDPGVSDSWGDTLVFTGRLSPEKGLRTVLAAWEQDSSLPILHIIGDGPQADEIRDAAARDPRIVWLGKLPLEELLTIVGRAKFLVMPSVWYETFGRTTIEAFAKGTPVIGSRIGGTAEIITEGKNGFLFEAGNSLDLQRAIRQAMLRPTNEYALMRQTARTTFETKYTSQANYDGLMEAYHRAIHNARTPHGSK